MEPKRKSSDESRPAEPTPAPKKHFRIEKLEERIAPVKGGKGTNNCGGGGSSNSGSGNTLSAGSY
jgi:hypothetical protein